MREFCFLKFSPKHAQELTLAQGSVCFLISAESASHPSPSLLAAKLLLSLQSQDRVGRERWQHGSVCMSIDASCGCVTAATRGEKLTCGSVLFLVSLLPFSPVPVTGSGLEQCSG